jgi:CHAD domain-containing protein
MVLSLARWLAQPHEGEPAGRGLRKVARRALRKAHRKVLDDARQLSRDDAVQRHRIRIAAKRLRYAVDALAGLYPGRRVKPLARALGKLQAALGDANDAAVAWRLIAPLEPPPALAQFAHGWLEARSAASIEHFERHVARLAAASPFWRKT